MNQSTSNCQKRIVNKYLAANNFENQRLVYIVFVVVRIADLMTETTAENAKLQIAPSSILCIKRMEGRNNLHLKPIHSYSNGYISYTINP